MPLRIPRMTLALAVGVLALVMAPTANAGQIVWQKGSEIWAMNDDGSNQRVLIPLAKAPGMDRLGSPHLHPSGTTIVFEGSTDRNRHWVSRPGGGLTYHWGYNGTGVYKWQDGSAARLSPEPSPCTNCTTFFLNPEIQADGSHISHFMSCSGASFSCEHSLPNSWSFEPACSSPEGPSPNPANPGEVAYVGCIDGGSGAAALMAAGPNHANERVVSCDDAPQADPSWSPGGDSIVTAEGGEDPGLWEYDPGTNICAGGDAYYTLVQPDGVGFFSPRYVGESRIAFEAGSEIWTIPADCAQCSFPASATKLTSGGDNHAPAWTSASSFSTGGGGGGDTTPGSTPPKPKISKGPPRKTKKRRASFSFKAAGKGKRFECKLDKGKFKPCTSPHRVKVKPGKHVFQVRAVDGDGNAGKPAKRAWTVKR